MSASPEPRVIRRYQNRKLYDTNRSAYVTLDDIEQMIQDGVEIKVIDNKSKEDLTSLTLAQIIFESEKKNRAFLPLGALKRIIQSGQDSIHDLMDKVVAPRLSMIQHTRAEVEKAIERLAQKKDIPPKEREHLLRAITANTQRNLEEFSERIEDNVKSFFERTRVVTKLVEKVAALEIEVAELERGLRDRLAASDGNGGLPAPKRKRGRPKKSEAPSPAVKRSPKGPV
ncbi:transcriptional regulator [bacterium]|nr:transcriptional regulator [bacterium]